MRVVSPEALDLHLGRLPVPHPRVVASGNFASPGRLLPVADAALEAYRLFVLNAQPGMPSRAGVVHETAFVGPGGRHDPALRYVPARLSLVPRLLAGGFAPDIVLLHTSEPRGDTVSLGTEVSILPAAIEACRSRRGLVVAQLNRPMPYTYGGAVVPADKLDLAVEADDELACLEPPRPDDGTFGAAARGPRISLA